MQSDSVEAVNENVTVTEADKDKTEASSNVWTGIDAKTFSRPLLDYARGRLMIGTSMPSLDTYSVVQLLIYFKEGKY